MKVAVARDRRAPYRYTFSGGLTAPIGVAPKAMCTGDLRVDIKRGKKVVASVTAPLRMSAGGRCAYRLNVGVPRAKLASHGSLVATIRFVGTPTTAAVAGKSQRLRYG